MNECTDIAAQQKIGDLKARCDILEARVAALIAFTAAILQDHPRRDLLQTRWANAIGPALLQIGPGLGDLAQNQSTAVPGWATHYIEDGSARPLP